MGTEDHVKRSIATNRHAKTARPGTVKMLREMRMLRWDTCRLRQKKACGALQYPSCWPSQRSRCIRLCKGIKRNRPRYTVSNSYRRSNLRQQGAEEYGRVKGGIFIE
ncbi:hypothetical protein TcCL_ESM00244 [Trypanosoma cruzi]|nr:hypothetical protein TcCL_ESM00244 [Trypanosoma cruzi]